MRALATIVLTLVPMVSISWARKSRCTGVKALKEASSMTPRTWSSTTIGRMIRLPGVVWPSPEEMM